MDSTTTALGIAIVGVLGTLLAPIVSQALSTKARREEFQQQRAVQLEEYDRQQSEKAAEAKRSCYLRLFIASRHYRVVLINYLHTVNREGVDESARSRLEEARRGFLASISETQLTGSLLVIEALGPLRAANTKAYSAIKDLEEGHPQQGFSFEEIRGFLLTAWDEEWSQIVRTVRADLGFVD
jgi:type II secretory pathway pseudopilin PulG